MDNLIKSVLTSLNIKTLDGKIDFGDLLILDKKLYVVTIHGLKKVSAFGLINRDPVAVYSHYDKSFWIQLSEVGHHLPISNNVSFNSIL